MAYPGTTLVDTQNALAAALGIDAGGAALPNSYKVNAQNALNEATADYLLFLAQAGYAPNDAINADYAGVYVSKLALYYALGKCGSLKAYPKPDENTLSPVEELKTMTTLIVGGVAVAPQPGESMVGGISAGYSTSAQVAFEQYWARTSGYGCNPYGPGYPVRPNWFGS